MAKSKTYLTRDLQNVYDLAVQLYGDVSKIGILLDLFPNLDEVIDLNSSIVVPDQLDPVAIYFRDSGLIVSTDFVSGAVDNPTFDSSVVKWDSDVYSFDMT